MIFVIILFYMHFVYIWNFIVLHYFNLIIIIIPFFYTFYFTWYFCLIMSLSYNFRSADLELLYYFPSPPPSPHSSSRSLPPQLSCQSCQMANAYLPKKKEEEAEKSPAKPHHPTPPHSSLVAPPASRVLFVRKFNA